MYIFLPPNEQSKEEVEAFVCREDETRVWSSVWWRKAQLLGRVTQFNRAPLKFGTSQPRKSLQISVITTPFNKFLSRNARSSVLSKCVLDSRVGFLNLLFMPLFSEWKQKIFNNAPAGDCLVHLRAFINQIPLLNEDFSPLTNPFKPESDRKLVECGVSVYFYSDNVNGSAAYGCYDRHKFLKTRSSEKLKDLLYVGDYKRRQVSHFYETI